MDVKHITGLHANLLTGISIEDLSDNALLRYGGLLIKSFKSSKQVLRKLEAHQAEELKHWTMVKAYTYDEIDNGLKELETRMSVGLEDFGEKSLLGFTELVSNIRYVIYFEKQLDEANYNGDEDNVELIFD